jgi:hypothetical protein
MQKSFFEAGKQFGAENVEVNAWQCNEIHNGLCKSLKGMDFCRARIFAESSGQLTFKLNQNRKFKK